MKITGSVIVITGAGRGIGAGIATALAAQGARLALVDLDAGELESTRQTCIGLGGEANCYLVNVADESAVEQLFAQVLEDFGSLHGLVNNAGITRDSLLVKVKDGQVTSRMSLAEWQAVIDVNLTGVFLCGRAAAEQMITQGVDEGVIINISSISRVGNIGQTNYSAAKAGVAAMTTTWAKELGRYNIRSAAIAPGFIGTEMVQQMPDEILKKTASLVPLGRMGGVESIAQTVAFILENSYVTGRVIEIDGGLRI